MAFTGIPAEAFDFYDGLKADNSKVYWTEHRADYERFVREPIQEIADAVAPSYGPARIYRPYRDLRFSRDKTPYKDHQGMFVETRNGIGWYVQVSASGLMAAGGWHSSTPQQVARFRAAVAADEAGGLQRLIDQARRAALTVGGQRLKTRPRDYPADHPRIDLLRHRSLYLSRSWEPDPWMGTPAALDRITSTWDAMRPVLAWLADAVGPADAEPRRR